MSSRLDRLLNNYTNHISVPWQKGLAGVQKVIFVVYDIADELRFRAHLTEFSILLSGMKSLVIEDLVL